MATKAVTDGMQCNAVFINGGVIDATAVATLSSASTKITSVDQSLATRSNIKGVDSKFKSWASGRYALQTVVEVLAVANDRTVVNGGAVSAINSAIKANALSSASSTTVGAD